MESQEFVLAAMSSLGTPMTPESDGVYASKHDGKVDRICFDDVHSSTGSGLFRITLRAMLGLALLLYVVAEKCGHPARHSPIPNVTSCFIAIAKYLNDSINSHDEKKQHPRGVPDSIQPRITLAQTK
jgi:hypothetical protein